MGGLGCLLSWPPTSKAALTSCPGQTRLFSDLHSAPSEKTSTKRCFSLFRAFIRALSWSKFCRRDTLDEIFFSSKMALPLLGPKSESRASRVKEEEKKKQDKLDRRRRRRPQKKTFLFFFLIFIEGKCIKLRPTTTWRQVSSYRRRPRNWNFQRAKTKTKNRKNFYDAYLIVTLAPSLSPSGLLAWKRIKK